MVVKQGPKGGSNSRSPKGAGDNKLATFGLGAVIVVALVLAIYFGKNFFSGVMAENQDFKPSQKMIDAFNRVLPKEYTPYGQPPKPGENRPPWGTFIPPELMAERQKLLDKQAKNRPGGAPGAVNPAYD